MTEDAPGIVPGRLDPYTYAAHTTALHMARLGSQVVGETGSYAIKHDELWKLQMAADAAVRALWVAISDHAVHCRGCDQAE